MNKFHFIIGDLQRCIGGWFGGYVNYAEQNSLMRDGSKAKQPGTVVLKYEDAVNVLNTLIRAEAAMRGVDYVPRPTFEKLREKAKLDPATQKIFDDIHAAIDKVVLPR